MFYVTDDGTNTDDLESGTDATFYIPFLVQSAENNKDLLIPASGTAFHLNINDSATDGADQVVTPNPTYAAGDKSITIPLSGEVDFDGDTVATGNGDKMIF